MVQEHYPEWELTLTAYIKRVNSLSKQITKPLTDANSNLSEAHTGEPKVATALPRSDGRGNYKAAQI